MKRTTSNIVGISIAALALSTLVVGVAWASTSASRNPDTQAAVSDTTAPTQDSVPNDENNDDENKDDDTATDPGEPLDNDKLTQLVVSLSEQIDELSGLVNEGLADLDAAVKRVDGLNVDVVEAQKDAASALSQSKKASTAAEKADLKIDTLATTVDTISEKVVAVSKRVDTISESVDAVSKRVDTVSAAVTAIEAKLVKINDEGTYTGTITPAQLTRKLTALDLSGDWPLDRTSGDLEAAKLKGPTFGCSSSYGFNTFASFDAWSRIVCVRVPK